MHIPARKGEWSQTSVFNILTNEVYLGKIRWRREPVKRVVRDGMIAKKRIKNDDYELYEGRHEAIVTQEQWELVKAAQAQRFHAPKSKERHLQNPFAGLLFCDNCGSIIKRRVPDKRRTPTAWYRCLKRGCDCKNIKCDTLEKGIYSIEIFTKRNAVLTKEIRQLQFSEADLLKQKGDGDEQKAGAQRIPTAQHILDSYPSLTVEEKNQLWRLVLDKVTVYRSQDDELTVHLYPKLPGK